MTREELIEEICLKDRVDKCVRSCLHFCDTCDKEKNELFDKYDKQIRKEVINELLDISWHSVDLWDFRRKLKEQRMKNTQREIISIRHRLGEYDGFKPLDEDGVCRSCPHLCYEDDYMQVYCDSKECVCDDRK